MTTTRTTTLRAKRSRGGGGGKGRKGKGAGEEAKRIGRDAFFLERGRVRAVGVNKDFNSVPLSLFVPLALCKTTTPPKPSGRRSGPTLCPSSLSSPRKFLVPRRFRESIMRSLRASCRAALRRVGSHRVDDRSSTRRRKEEEREEERKGEREKEGKGREREWNRMEERESDDDPSFRPVFNNGPLL